MGDLGVALFSLGGQSVSVSWYQDSLASLEMLHQLVVNMVNWRHIKEQREAVLCVGFSRGQAPAPKTAGGGLDAPHRCKRPPEAFIGLT